MAEWWCMIGGSRRGPFGDEQLRAMAQAGQIAPTDLLWNPSASRWDKANRLRGLFPPQVIAAATTVVGGAVDAPSVAAQDVGPFLKLNDRFCTGGAWWAGPAVASPQAFYLVKTGVASGPGALAGGALGVLLARAFARRDDVRSCSLDELPADVRRELDPQGRFAGSDVVVLPKAAISKVELSGWRGCITVHCGGQRFTVAMERTVVANARGLLAEIGWTLDAELTPSAQPIHSNGYGRRPGEKSPHHAGPWARLAYALAAVVVVALYFLARNQLEAFGR